MGHGCVSRTHQQRLALEQRADDDALKLRAAAIGEVDSRDELRLQTLHELGLQLLFRRLLRGGGHATSQRRPHHTQPGWHARSSVGPRGEDQRPPEIIVLQYISTIALLIARPAAMHAISDMQMHAVDVPHCQLANGRVAWRWRQQCLAGASRLGLVIGLVSGGCCVFLLVIVGRC
jgi:hypothetical protein